MPPIKPQIKHSTFARQRLTLGGLMGLSGSSMDIITPPYNPFKSLCKREIHSSLLPHLCTAFIRLYLLDVALLELASPNTKLILPVKRYAQDRAKSINT